MCSLIESSLSPDLFFIPMPPKRDAGANPTHPPVKMIKIGSDAQEFGFDSAEDKYRLGEESSFSPFANNDVRDFDSICEVIKTADVYLAAPGND